MRIALIHATPLAIAPINEAFARLWPAVQRMNVLDDTLSGDRAAAGALTPAMIGRFEFLARYCVEHGADGILFTCSAFGPAIEAARAAVGVPVLKPNEAMLGEALELGARGRRRVALIATFAPSLDSIAAELSALADAQGQRTALCVRYVPGAMAALDAGDGSRHDALIAGTLDTWAEWKDCDAIMLAQFSMARARAVVAARTKISVLVSTDSAVAAMRSALR